MKQNKNTFVVFVCFIVLVISILPSPVFADPATAAAEAFALWAQSYGMANGAGISFSGVNSNGYSSFWNDEFDAWQQHKLTLDPNYQVQNISDFVTNNQSNTSYEQAYGQTYGDNTIGASYYTMLKLNDTITGYLDDFYNWLLDTLGFSYSSTSGGFSHTSGSFESDIIIEQSLFVNFDNQPLPLSSPGIHLGYSGNTSIDVYCPTDSSCYACLVNGYLAFLGTTYRLYSVYWSNGNSFTSVNGTVTGQYSQLYMQKVTSYLLNSNTLPNYSSIQDAADALYLYLNDGVIPAGDSYSISLTPYYPKTDGVISIPDTSAQDYVAQPVDTVIGIPWDSTYIDTSVATPAIAEEVSDLSLTGELELVETLTPPSFSEVYIPFLPVNLPSFNFSLSGIWHYVRDWIQSLSSWFSLMLTIWAGLPYAMVVPVYASMVILVVVGVYRRFFM